MPTTILTGLQPTGNLHIGNYFGGILPMVEKSKSLAPDDKLFMFVPDLHALTIDMDYQAFYQIILNNVRTYLASGIDFGKENICVYRQSFIPAHSELTWLLNCFTYFGELHKMTQFKDKSSQHDKNINAGLFVYPVLMVADILLYGADFVPVGEDQRQHLELARNVAIRINNKFDQKIFTPPHTWEKQLEFTNLAKGIRIRNLTNPEKKMSKSEPSEKSKINLTDEPQVAVKKILSCTTDNLSQINWDWDKQPGITNLLQIFSLLSQISEEQTKTIWTHKTSYKDLKVAVAELVEKFLVDFQAKLNQVSQQDVLKALETGEQKASVVANQNLFNFQKVLGLRA